MRNGYAVLLFVPAFRCACHQSLLLRSSATGPRWARPPQKSGGLEYEQEIRKRTR